MNDDTLCQIFSYSDNPNIFLSCKRFHHIPKTYKSAGTRLLINVHGSVRKAIFHVQQTPEDKHLMPYLMILRERALIKSIESCSSQNTTRFENLFHDSFMHCAQFNRKEFLDRLIKSRMSLEDQLESDRIIGRALTMATAMNHYDVAHTFINTGSFSFDDEVLSNVILLAIANHNITTYHLALYKMGGNLTFDNFKLEEALEIAAKSGSCMFLKKLLEHVTEGVRTKDITEEELEHLYNQIIYNAGLKSHMNILEYVSSKGIGSSHLIDCQFCDILDTQNPQVMRKILDMHDIPEDKTTVLQFLLVESSHRGHEDMMELVKDTSGFEYDDETIAEVLLNCIQNGSVWGVKFSVDMINAEETPITCEEIPSVLANSIVSFPNEGPQMCRLIMECSFLRILPSRD